LDPNDSNDKSFKLKFVADNAVTEDFWLALNGDDEYYLEVAGSYGAQFDPAAKFDIGNNFYNKYPGSGNNLSDYRLKVWDQTENCLGWKREIVSPIDEPFEATKKACTSSLNVHETLIPKFNTVSVYLTEQQCHPSVCFENCHSCTLPCCICFSSRLERSKLEDSVLKIKTAMSMLSHVILINLLSSGCMMAQGSAVPGIQL